MSRQILGNQKGGWKGVLIGCLVVIVVLVAALIGVTWYGVKKAKEFINIEPAKVVEMASDEINYQMPVESEGAWGFEIMGYKLAIIKNVGDPLSDLLIVGSFPEKEKQEEFKKYMKQRVSYDDGDLTVETVTVCGVETQANVGTGVFDIKDNKVEMAFVQVIIPQDDKVLFIMAGCAGENKEARARELFSTISCRE